MYHLLLTTTFFFLISNAISQPIDLHTQKALISVDRIWDRAQHNAFTDLVYFKGKFYCTFREGSGHIPGINGTVRVIASTDGQNWQSVAHLAEQGVDLRDPKLCVTPMGKLMISMGGSYYVGRTLGDREPRVSFSDESGSTFSDPIPVDMPADIRTNGDWLWRVSWYKGSGYGVVYQANEGEWGIHLVSTKDGLSYQKITSFELDGKPNETTLRFANDGTMMALVRREGGDQEGMIGSSKPPYKDWAWHKLGARLGGPNMIQLPNGKWLAASRDYLPEKKYQTILALIDTEGGFKKIITLPSDRDTSYPGLVVKDGILYVSYYSGHEGRTSIYLAKLWVSEL